MPTVSLRCSSLKCPQERKVLLFIGKGNFFLVSLLSWRPHRKRTAQMCRPIVRRSQFFFSSTRRVLRQWRFLQERILEVAKLICQWVGFAEKYDRYLATDAQLFRYTWHNAFACKVQAVHSWQLTALQEVDTLFARSPLSFLFDVKYFCMVRTRSTLLKGACVQFAVARGALLSCAPQQLFIFLRVIHSCAERTLHAKIAIDTSPPRVRFLHTWHDACA